MAGGRLLAATGNSDTGDERRGMSGSARKKTTQFARHLHTTKTDWSCTRRRLTGHAHDED